MYFCFLFEDFTDYPWSRWLSNPLQNDNLIFWLDLASYRFELDAGKSVADFLLLLMVACQVNIIRIDFQIFRNSIFFLFYPLQEYAFRNESSSPAGDNESIYANSGRYGLKRDNPTYDFIAQQQSVFCSKKLLSIDFLRI